MEQNAVANQAYFMLCAAATVKIQLDEQKHRLNVILPCGKNIEIFYFGYK